MSALQLCSVHSRIFIASLA